MIREWKGEEIYTDRLALFMERFDQATEFVKTKAEYAKNAYIPLLEKGVAHILVAEEDGVLQGAIAFIVSSDLSSPGLYAVETFWFVAPEYAGVGKQLFKAFEAKAKELGCTKTSMTHLTDSYPDSLKLFYEKNGYKLTELHYIKEL